MSDYQMPENLFGWLNAHTGQKVYIQVEDGTEWTGTIMADSPVGTVDLAGWSFRTRIKESTITGVEEADA